MTKLTKKSMGIDLSLLVIFSFLLQTLSFPLLVMAAPNAPTIIYVDQDAVSGANTGASWADAFTDLQSALASALPGTSNGFQIWVAEGTYKPTSTSDRTLSFGMKNGMALYGGFSGAETALSQRDWLAHLTILSGNIGDPANAEDNSFHVVTSQNTNATSILDGFTIQDGHANGYSDSYGTFGGGILVLIGDPALSHLRIASNYAYDWGGGLYTQGGGEASFNSPSLSDIIFTYNTANNFDSSYSAPDGRGGGMAGHWSSPTLIQVDFIHNAAVSSGGGYYSEGGNPILDQVNFNNNGFIIPNGWGSGGGLTIVGGNAHLTDVSFSSNFALYGGGLTAGGTTGNILTLNHVTFGANIASSVGGGMDLSGVSAVLVDVNFNANRADYGGGISLFSGATLHMLNSTLSANVATTSFIYRGGGGIYTTDNSSIDLVNVVFTGNQAVRGGGAFFSQLTQLVQPDFHNITFSGNQASLQGGAIYSDANVEPVISNSILWGDSAPQGPEIYLAGSTSITVNFSDVQGGWAGAHNIDANPLFLQSFGLDGITPDDNLRLFGLSPAIDAGSNALVPPDSADLNGNGNFTELLPYDRDGHPRFIRSDREKPTGQGSPAIVDMGAYEAPVDLLYFIPQISTN